MHCEADRRTGADFPFLNRSRDRALYEWPTTHPGLGLGNSVVRAFPVKLKTESLISS
jgi:hypothetical protein